MTASPPLPRGKVAIIVAGSAGMAAALSVHQAGHEVVLLERYPQARPAGNILNLWPRPIKALGLLGVDTDDLDPHATRNSPEAMPRSGPSSGCPPMSSATTAAGSSVLLRPELYERLLAALPPGVLRVNSAVTSFEQDDSGVRLLMADGSTIEADVLVGTDGIDSLVRSALWGSSPKREHNLHIIGGFTFDETVQAERGRCVVMHNKITQGSWTSIRNKGRDGFQWWVLTGHDAAEEAPASSTRQRRHWLRASSPRCRNWLPRQRQAMCRGGGSGIANRSSSGPKAAPPTSATPPHPTSPYAAYGAGMATEDGYFLGRRLAGVNLKDPVAVREALHRFESPRKPHTRRQSQQVYILGQVFHHAPAALRPVRDLVFDHTPILQKVVGDATPGEILKQIDEFDRAEEHFRELHR